MKKTDKNIDNTQSIKNEITKAFARLGGQSDLLSTINSWGKELPDEDVLGSLKSWNKSILKEKEEKLKNLKEFYK